MILRQRFANAGDVKKCLYIFLQRGKHNNMSKPKIRTFFRIDGRRCCDTVITLPPCPKTWQIRVNTNGTRGSLVFVSRLKIARSTH